MIAHPWGLRIQYSYVHPNASANTRGRLWSPHTSPEQALFFRLGTLHLIGQHCLCTRIPSHYRSHGGGTQKRAHITCRSTRTLLLHVRFTASLYGIKPRIVCRSLSGAFPSGDILYIAPFFSTCKKKEKILRIFFRKLRKCQ